MQIVALDPSLTGFGWARSVPGSDLGELSGPAWESGVFVPKGRGVRRLQAALDQVVEITDGAEVVLIEGYAFSSRQSHAHGLGELGGVVRLGLFQRSIPFVEIPPACVKKLATGRGNAKKEAVLVEAVKRLGYGGADNNVSDALFILQAGLIHYDLPGAVPLPKTHLDGLRKIEWPELGARV